MKIKFPLAEDEKQKFRDRLEMVLSQTEGEQVIILWDKEKLTDYYQNICVPHLIKKIKESAEEYSDLAPGLISKEEDAKT